MSVTHFDIKQIRQDLGLFDSAIEKVAFTPAAAPPPPMTQMPPEGAMPPGGAPMGPEGAPMPPMDPNGQPMPPDAGMPPMGPEGMPPAGGVDPQLEGMLAQLADGVTGMGNEVQSQREQIDQLTQRLLQMEQQMSSFQDGLKNPAPLEQSEEQAQIPGQPL